MTRYFSSSFYYKFLINLLLGDHYSFYGTQKHGSADEGLANGAMFSMVVEDPRLTLPLQKQKPSFNSTMGT